MQVTFNGETIKELKAQLEYCNVALSQVLQSWEKKEFISVKKDLLIGIESIKTRQKILKK
jgi:hypothetical protein